MTDVDPDAVMGTVLRRMRVRAGLTVAGAASASRLGSRHILALEDGQDAIYFTELLELMDLYRSTPSEFVLRVGAELERQMRLAER